MLLWQIPESLQEALDISLASLFHSLTRVQAPCLAPCWDWSGDGDVGAKAPKARGLQGGGWEPQAPQHCCSSPASIQWPHPLTSPHHPPLSLPFLPGPGKALPPAFQREGWALLIIMMMLAIYLLHPGGWSTLHPHPCQMPASPRLFPCLLLLALVMVWVFSPALGTPWACSSGRTGELVIMDISGLCKPCAVCL